MSQKKRRETLSKKLNEAHKEIIVKGPEGPKLTISIYDAYRLSPGVLAMARGWRKSIWKKEK